MGYEKSLTRVIWKNCLPKKALGNAEMAGSLQAGGQQMQKSTGKPQLGNLRNRSRKSSWLQQAK